MNTEKNLGGELSGTLSNEVDPAVKSLDLLKKQILASEALVENMTRSGENVSPDELQEARDYLAELRKDLKNREDLVK
ncbi:MAG: hypothetical protein NTW66_02695 [Candidatus Magasanikbacteria bacterium]|nr:hypothetical protein [Candidatus Magasanikbacteria bacterium]